jgi:hypothetical protein
VKRIVPIIALAGLACALSVRADIVPYNDPGKQGTQSWGGNLALNFNVLSPINVTGLGIFNASGSGTISGTIQVVIYNTGTSTQVTPVATFHGNYTPSALGFDVFQSISPVLLGVGSYQVDAVGFNSIGDPNGNINTGSSTGPLLNSGGSLSFTGAGYDASSTLDNPTTCVGCQATPAQYSQFDAGTFEFLPASSTPEPASIFLLLTVFLATGLLVGKKHFRRSPSSIE